MDVDLCGNCILYFQHFQQHKGEISFIALHSCNGIGALLLVIQVYLVHYTLD